LKVSWCRLQTAAPVLVRQFVFSEEVNLQRRRRQAAPLATAPLRSTWASSLIAYRPSFKSIPFYHYTKWIPFEAIDSEIIARAEAVEV
jgi:hypothetical protein